ncbi:vacuolar protein sorting-associated protein 2 homolog 2 isoform X1 [Gossypium hirsutum]|uniref:Vacuolar protein sorting-associated protein 2 homolog 2 isoform X1 n=1 Tax=Gossypium hirsutum TaxID=3635 RepID=A0A1U8PET3_GOSHI|nr:vacuolar protein sorting-associated protein 2 homolog 2 isoform X1 [Gossypium hirsutum]
MFLSPLSLKSSSSFFVEESVWIFCICLFYLDFASFNCFFLYFLQLDERERLPTVIRLTGVKLSPILYISSNRGTGSEAAARILARQLVRLRQQITNLQGSRAQITGVATHTLALYANTSISTGIKGATKAMVAMNKIEMMSEAIDETLDKDEVEKETEKLTNQLSSAPKGRIASKNATPLVNVKSEPTTNVDDLEKRLASLQ